MEKITDDIYRFSGGDDNAYLIKGETNVLIDGVRAEYAEEYIKSVSETVNISDIKYIVINHSEPNRSGTLDAVLRENPDITVIASTAGLKFLGDLVESGFKSMLAKDGMELELNGKVMKFVYIPYINWPDSMVTIYDKALFSCDFFSRDKCSDYLTYASKYFSAQNFKAAAETIRGIEYEFVLQGSGTPLALEGPLNFYFTDSKNDPVLILYSSAYGTTKKMAEIVGEVFGDIKTEMYNIDEIDADAAAEKINNCRALVLGVNTINADAPKKLWSIIGKTDKLSNKRKPCMLFGAYGWSNEGLYYIEHHLKMLRYDIFKKPFEVVLKLKPSDCDALKTYAADFVGYINEL